jgi:hypothetical protein
VAHHWRRKRNPLPLSKRAVVFSLINTATMTEEQEGESDNDNHGVMIIHSRDSISRA